MLHFEPLKTDAVALFSETVNFGNFGQFRNVGLVVTRIALVKLIWPRFNHIRVSCSKGCKTPRVACQHHGGAKLRPLGGVRCW